MPRPILLDLEPAADELGVSRSTLYRLLNDGSVRSVKIGRRRLIERDELVRFVGMLRSDAATR
jgi:excisionase family DNA binding protein